jgi:hypothetical protein
MSSHSQDYRGAEAYRSSAYEADYRGAGWVAFAAMMLGLAGIWNVMEGLLAIGGSRVYVADSVFVFSDLNTWGWIIVVLGVAQLLAAFAIVSGSEFGRWFGVAAAFVNAIGQLYFLPAYPLWAMTMFAVDVLIIYALVVYGGRKLREE